MIEYLFAALAGGAVTALAVIPYAVRLDRAHQDLSEDYEQQTHALANAAARLRDSEQNLANAAARISDSDQQLVDAAVRRVEDGAVIQRLNHILEVAQDEVKSLTEQLVIESRASKRAD